MTDNHIFNTGKRRLTITADESPDEVRLSVQFSAFGALGDELELNSYVLATVAKYETDPRRIVFINGKTAVVIKRQADGSYMSAVAPLKGAS
jgi:hypothetical protein